MAFRGGSFVCDLYSRAGREPRRPNRAGHPGKLSRGESNYSSSMCRFESRREIESVVYNFANPFGEEEEEEALTQMAGADGYS